MASVYEETKLYRKRLLRREARIVAEMLRDWQRIAADLKARAIAIGDKIEQAALAGTPIEPVWLFQQERVDELLRQAERQVRLLVDKHVPLIELEARKAALDGATVAARQVAVSTAFSTRLSLSAIEAIAAATRQGALADLLAGIDVGAALRDSLLRGVARGANPRVIAAEVSRGLDRQVKSRMLTIARTEVARAQRQATYDAYNALGVTTWQWLSARDATTCAACWAMDGEEFGEFDIADDHPNGRCAIVPVVDGVQLAEVPDKMDVWDRLSASDQTRILGPTRYDLVQKGELTLSRQTADNPTGIGGTTTSTDWGTSIRVAALPA